MGKRYLRLVFDQAVSDTFAVAEIKHPKALVFAGLGVALMVGILANIGGPLAVFDYLKMILAAVFVFVVEVALFFAWHVVMAPGKLARQDAAKIAAKDAEMAALKASLEPVFQVTVQGAGGQKGQSIVYLEVENTGANEVRNARGRLISLGYRDLDVPLAWAQPDNPTDKSRRTFHGKARLNVAVSGSPNWMAAASAFPLDTLDHERSRFMRDAVLKIQVELSADNAPREVWLFGFRWYSHVGADNPDGSQTIYILDGEYVEISPPPQRVEPTPSPQSTPHTAKAPNQ
jgi:hypothetical protein